MQQCLSGHCCTTPSRFYISTMIKKALLSLFFLSVTLTLSAQYKITDKLERSEWGSGKVTVHQDSRLYNLLGTIYDPSNSQKLQTKGYRIQVYAGNNTREAREAAMRAAEQVRYLWPELSVYTEFISPRWVCRVGDYRSMEEADQMLREMKKTGRFRDIILLPNQTINVNLNY